MAVGSPTACRALPRCAAEPPAAAAAPPPCCRAFAKRSKGKVVFLDCGRLFIRGRSIDAGLMADAIHPTAAGWGKLAACMLPTIRRLA